jgi:transcriptional regulator with XRE-family HTH domain
MKESFEGAVAQMDDPEFRHAYAASFMNSLVAAQIKAIREQREMTQAQLAELIGTKQAGISRLENVNYDAWKVGTLAKLARAFDVRLRISFEDFDSLIDEVRRFRQSTLERESYVKANKRQAIEEADTLSENLKRALDPTRPIAPQRESTSSGETKRKEERNALAIGSACKSLRLLNPRGTDAGDGDLSPKPSGLSGGEMPIPKEPEYASGVQSA